MTQPAKQPVPLILQQGTSADEPSIVLYYEERLRNAYQQDKTSLQAQT